MYEEELDEVELFFLDVAYYVEDMTVIKNYLAMTNETKIRYIEKLLLDICYKTSPKKNYGITKQELREYVHKVLNYLETKETGLKK